jgi:hypothetical protein
MTSVGIVVITMDRPNCIRRQLAYFGEVGYGDLVTPVRPANLMSFFMWRFLTAANG